MHARIYINQLLMGLKIYMRVPAAMFWIIAFPIAMLVGLGTVLGGKDDNTIKLVWVQTVAPDANDIALQKALSERGVAVEALAPAEAEARWQQGKMPVMLEGQDGNYKLRSNSYLAMQSMMINGLVQQAYLTAQARVRGAGDLARIPTVSSSPGGHQGGPYAAYLLPGLLGLNLLMMGLFSVGMVDVTQREKGGYKRLATTPLPRHVYLAAQVSVRLIVSLVAALLLLLAGVVVFGIHNQGSYVGLLGLVLLGASCFICMGYVLASFAKNVDSYGGIANMVLLPLMMLSGVYFSLDSAPAWLQRTVDFLPLTPLLKALRAVYNDGASLTSLSPSLMTLGVWTLLLFVAATRRFKWS
jgi:ABC transporter DrrB family efflux protein